MGDTKFFLVLCSIRLIQSYEDRHLVNSSLFTSLIDGYLLFSSFYCSHFILLLISKHNRVKKNSYFNQTIQKNEQVGHF